MREPGAMRRQRRLGRRDSAAGAGGSQSGPPPLCLGVSQLTQEMAAGRGAAPSPMPPGFSLDGFPPAFQLACACCMWPPSAERDALVRAAAEGVDWARFLRVLTRQRVTGLAREALRSAGVAPPPEVEQRLTASAKAGAVRGLALAAEALRLSRLLDTEGVPAL